MDLITEQLEIDSLRFGIWPQFQIKSIKIPNQVKLNQSPWNLCCSIDLVNDDDNIHVAGQTADIFPESALQSELSLNDDDADNNADVADDDRDVVDDGNEDAEDEAGIASGDEDHVVETTLQSDEMLLTTQRQHSTTEYLPGMLHSNSPPGLLPKFPSWSILQLGDYSSYNPATGNCILTCILFTNMTFISSKRQHLSWYNCLEEKVKIIRTVLCCILSCSCTQS